MPEGRGWPAARLTSLMTPAVKGSRDVTEVGEHGTSRHSVRTTVMAARGHTPHRESHTMRVVVYVLSAIRWYVFLVLGLARYHPWPRPIKSTTWSSSGVEGYNTTQPISRSNLVFHIFTSHHPKSQHPALAKPQDSHPFYITCSTCKRQQTNASLNTQEYFSLQQQHGRVQQLRRPFSLQFVILHVRRRCGSVCGITYFGVAEPKQFTSKLPPTSRQFGADKTPGVAG